MRKNLDDAIRRLSDFYNREGKDRVFITVDVEEAQAPIDKEMKVLKDGMDIDWFFSHWNRYFTRLYDLEDDSIPTIYLTPFDQGLYGSLLGADMVINKPIKGPRHPLWIGSMTKPLKHFDPKEWKWDDDNLYLRRFTHDLRYVADKARGKFGVGVIITVDALNFVGQVLGTTKALVGLYRNRREVRGLMEFALELNVKLVELQREIIDFTYRGGVFDFFGGWLPRQSVPMSVDLYHFCRSEMYADVGRTYQQRLIDQFGGGIFHIHKTGNHLVPELAKMRNIMAFWIMDHSHPIDAVGRLKDLSGEVPLIIDCTKQEFLKGFREKRLHGGVMYNVKVGTVSEGNSLVKKARRYIPNHNSSD